MVMIQVLMQTAKIVGDFYLCCAGEAIWHHRWGRSWTEIEAMLHIQTRWVGGSPPVTVICSQALRGELNQPDQWMKTLLWELTFQVLHVEVFKFPLDLAEQVHQIAAQRQRKLGVLQGSRQEVAVRAQTTQRQHGIQTRSDLLSLCDHIWSNNIPDYFLFMDSPSQIPVIKEGLSANIWFCES